MIGFGPWNREVQCAMHPYCRDKAAEPMKVVNIQLHKFNFKFIL